MLALLIDSKKLNHMKTSNNSYLIKCNNDSVSIYGFFKFYPKLES